LILDLHPEIRASLHEPAKRVVAGGFGSEDAIEKLVRLVLRASQLAVAGGEAKALRLSAPTEGPA
jgi:hypothetical protein